MFSLGRTYPDAKSLFTAWLQPLESLKDDCLVVVDTNVLLVPYTINPKTLDDVRNAYRSLIDQDRLHIPGHVAREFAKNRTQKIEELFQQLSRKRSKLSNLHSGRYPLLEPLPEYKHTLELEKKLDETLKQYRESIDKILGHVRAWTWNDPVSLMYSDLFDPRIVTDPAFAESYVREELDRRQEFRIPPGYKDASKDDSGVGDLLIWLTILQLGEEKKKHLLFVSGDEKSDWWHRSEREALYPRFELTDEYRRASNGKSFHITKFSTFLDLFGAERRVVEEVRQSEVRALTPRDTRHREFQRQIALAEIAVADWASREFAASEVETSRHRFPDMVVENNDGDRVGIEVAAVRRENVPSGFWMRRVMEKALRGYYEVGKDEIQAFAIALVTDSEAEAENILARLERTTQDFPPVNVYVGFLVGGSRFVEVGEVQFE